MAAPQTDNYPPIRDLDLAAFLVARGQVPVDFWFRSEPDGRATTLFIFVDSRELRALLSEWNARDSAGENVNATQFINARKWLLGVAKTHR